MRERAHRSGIVLRRQGRRRQRLQLDRFRLAAEKGGVEQPTAGWIAPWRGRVPRAARRLAGWHRPALPAIDGWRRLGLARGWLDDSRREQLEMLRHGDRRRPAEEIFRGEARRGIEGTDCDGRAELERARQAQPGQYDQEQRARKAPVTGGRGAGPRSQPGSARRRVERADGKTARQVAAHAARSTGFIRFGRFS